MQETFLDAHRFFEGFQGETEATLLVWVRGLGQLRELVGGPD